MAAPKSTPTRRATGTAAERVEIWRSHPASSIRAAVASAILRGEWVGPKEAAALGASGSVFSQTVTILRDAGIALSIQKRAYGGKAYRARPADAPARGRPRVPPEAEGAAYPALGTVLTVRALILATDGRTEVALTDGNGGAWTAHLTQ